MAFYAVKKGKNPGIYATWDEAKQQVVHFHNPVYKKFESKEEAEKFINSRQTAITEFFQVSEPQESDHNLICFTDGSALNNGQENCKGGFAVVWPFHPEHDYNEHLFPCTNNRAEYSAILHAIKQSDVLDPAKQKTLIIYTDSMLIVNSMVKWLPTWKKNNFKKADGTPVLNLDLITTIDNLSKTRKVAYRHVKAHTNLDSWESKHNAKADKMAKQAAFKN